MDEPREAKPELNLHYGKPPISKIEFRVNHGFGPMIVDRRVLLEPPICKNERDTIICEGEWDAITFEGVTPGQQPKYGLIERLYRRLNCWCIDQLITTLTCVSQSRENFVTYSPPWYYPAVQMTRKALYVILSFRSPRR